MSYTVHMAFVYMFLMVKIFQCMECYWSVAISQKRKCLHFDEIIITGCTGSCQSDNFQCSQWWKFRQNDDIFVSVIVKNVRGIDLECMYERKVCYNGVNGVCTRSKMSLRWCIYGAISWCTLVMCGCLHSTEVLQEWHHSGHSKITLRT